MSISFTDGVEGVKARDYSVFIREAEYELSGGFGNIITIDCPSIPILTKQVDLNFLTGFDLDIHRTLTPTGGTLTNSDLNKALSQPRVPVNATITYDGDSAQFGDYFMIKVFAIVLDIGSSILTINLGTETFVLNGLGYFKFTYDGTNWSLEQVGFHSIGVMTKDSINPKIEDGLTVDLNISGTKVLDKIANFSFSLMNLTLDNIAQMEALDKKKVEFLLFSSDKKHLYIFKPMMFNYSEDFKSGQVSTLPITLMKKITDVEDFRTIQDVSSLS